MLYSAQAVVDPEKPIVRMARAVGSRARPVMRSRPDTRGFTPLLSVTVPLLAL